MAAVLAHEDVLAAGAAVYPGFDRLGRPVEWAPGVARVEPCSRDSYMVMPLGVLAAEARAEHAAVEVLARGEIRDGEREVEDVALGRRHRPAILDQFDGMVEAWTLRNDGRPHVGEEPRPEGASASRPSVFHSTTHAKEPRAPKEDPT